MVVSVSVSERSSGSIVEVDGLTFVTRETQKSLSLLVLLFFSVYVSLSKNSFFMPRPSF